MRIEPEISQVVVVLAGSFSPEIFAPAWFALHRILPQSVTNNAAVKIVRPDITVFDADWINVEVSQDLFIAKTAQAPYIRVYEFVNKTLNICIPLVGLRAIGINRAVDFLVKSAEQRMQIGRTLAPIEPWNPWTHKLGLDSMNGGMTNITMSRTGPENRPVLDEINIIVRPSIQLKDKNRGIFVQVNDHYTADSTNSSSSMQLSEVFSEQFESSIERSEAIIDHVMSLANRQES